MPVSKSQTTGGQSIHIGSLDAAGLRCVAVHVTVTKVIRQNQNDGFWSRDICSVTDVIEEISQENAADTEQSDLPDQRQSSR